MIDELVEAESRARNTAAALGQAIDAAHIAASPSTARAVQARHNLYETIEREFGLLTSTEAGKRMGSRSTEPRNLALTAHKKHTILAIPRGKYLHFPGFQFDERGLRPVIAELLQLAREHQRTEPGLVQWLVAPTTYLDGRRPVDIIDSPEELLDVARRAFSVQW